MDRKKFFPILLAVFCGIIIFWLYYTSTQHESCVNVREKTQVNDTIGSKHEVSKSDTLLNNKRYIQTIDTVQKEIKGTSYLLHVICFLSAFALFILMLVVLDITREDYERNNKELDKIKTERAKILFEEWKKNRNVPLLKRFTRCFFSDEEPNKNKTADNNIGVDNEEKTEAKMNPAK